MEERRKFVRFGAWLHATWKVIDSKAVLTSVTRNVGGGGIGFFTEERLTSGSVLQIEIKLPNRQEPITFTAEVVWSSPLLLEGQDKQAPRAFETGVRFLNISPEDRVFIMDSAAKAAGTSQV